MLATLQTCIKEFLLPFAIPRFFTFLKLSTEVIKVALLNFNCLILSNNNLNLHIIIFNLSIVIEDNATIKCIY